MKKIKEKTLVLLTNEVLEKQVKAKLKTLTKWGLAGFEQINN